MIQFKKFLLVVNVKMQAYL